MMGWLRVKRRSLGAGLLLFASSLTVIGQTRAQAGTRLSLMPDHGPPGTVIGITGLSLCNVAFVAVTVEDRTGAVTSTDSGFTDADGNIIASVTAQGELGEALVKVVITNPVTDCTDAAQAPFLIVGDTPTPSASPSDKPSATPTETLVSSPTPGPSSTPPQVSTSTPTATPTPSLTPTATATITLSPTPSPTSTPTDLPSNTPPPTEIVIPTQSPSNTPAPPPATLPPPASLTPIPLVPTPRPTLPPPVTLAPQPTLEIVATAVVLSPTPAGCETTGDCTPTPTHTAPAPTATALGAGAVPLTGSTLPPEHCFVEEFVNTSGQTVNGLYVTLRGFAELTQTFTGPRNPFGAPQASSGLNPNDGSFRLDFRGAEVEPGGRAAVGSCGRAARLEFVGRDGLPSHFFARGAEPVLAGPLPPAVGFEVIWLTGGEATGSPSGSFVNDVFGPWLGRAAAQGMPTARLVLFNTSSDPGSDELLLSGLQVASVAGRPQVNDLSWESADRLGWRKAGRSDLFIGRGNSVSLEVRLGAGQSLAWRGLAVYVGGGPGGTSKIVGLVSPIEAARAETAASIRGPLVMLVVSALAGGVLGAFFLLGALRRRSPNRR